MQQKQKENAQKQFHATAVTNKHHNASPINCHHHEYNTATVARLYTLM